MEPQERKGLLGDALPDLKTMKLSDDALTGSFFTLAPGNGTTSSASRTVIFAVSATARQFTTVIFFVFHPISDLCMLENGEEVEKQ
jgi:hypothetical protein